MNSFLGRAVAVGGPRTNHRLRNGPSEMTQSFQIDAINSTKKKNGKNKKKTRWNVIDDAPVEFWGVGVGDFLFFFFLLLRLLRLS